MTGQDSARKVLGLFGLGAGTRRICPGGPECTCGKGVDLREPAEATR